MLKGIPSCAGMTAARGTIKEIGGDDKAAGLGDLQGSFTNTATDQGASSTSNGLTSPVAFKAKRLYTAHNLKNCWTGDGTR